MARPWIVALPLVVLMKLTVLGQGNFDWNLVSAGPANTETANSTLPWNQLNGTQNAPSPESQTGFFNWQTMSWTESRGPTKADQALSEGTTRQAQTNQILAPTTLQVQGPESTGQQPELVSLAPELHSREPELLRQASGLSLPGDLLDQVTGQSPIQEAQAIVASFTDSFAAPAAVVSPSPLAEYEKLLETQPVSDVQQALVIRTGENKLAAFQNSPTEEILLKPLRNITKSDTSTSVHPEVNLQRFTGPLGTTDQLFSDLKITRRFQDVAQLTNDECQHEHAHQAFTWASPNMYHQPLYFEQVNLERYGIGHRPCMQPLFSGLHFYGSVLMLPYKMYRLSPHECVYTLGHQRPGDAVCYQRHTALGASTAN